MGFRASISQPIRPMGNRPGNFAAKPRTIAKVAKWSATIAATSAGSGGLYYAATAAPLNSDLALFTALGALAGTIVKLSIVLGKRFGRAETKEKVQEMEKKLEKLEKKRPFAFEAQMRLVEERQKELESSEMTGIWKRIREIVDHGEEELADDARSLLMDRGEQEEEWLGPCQKLITRYEAQLEKNPYKYVKQIAQGAQADIVLFYNHRLGRDEVHKVLRPEHRNDEKMITRSFREATALAEIKDPGIPSIYEAKHNKDGLPYMAMEYIRGENLKEIISEMGRIPLPKAIIWMRSLNNTFKAVDAVELVHRDVKPENIMIEEANGIPMVIDFGIMKNMKLDSGLTKKGLTMGTPEYMSPEQARGEEKLDGFSDIYSLGVVFYEMLCGEVPFKAPPGVSDSYENFREFAVRICTETPPNIRKRAKGIPKKMQILLERMMAKNKNERPGHDEIDAELKKISRRLGIV